MNEKNNNSENSKPYTEVIYWVNRTLIYDAPPNDLLPVDAIEAEGDPYYLQDDEYEMSVVFNGKIDLSCRIKALRELTRMLEADEIDPQYNIY